MKRGDLVELRRKAALSPFRVADVQQGCVYVTCEIAGHSLGGYIPEDDLQAHHTAMLKAEQQTDLSKFQ